MLEGQGGHDELVVGSNGTQDAAWSRVGVEDDKLHYQCVQVPEKGQSNVWQVWDGGGRGRKIVDKGEASHKPTAPCRNEHLGDACQYIASLLSEP